MKTTYIIDTRHRAGLNISLLNVRRRARSNGRLAQALAALVSVAAAAVAVITTLNASH